MKERLEGHEQQLDAKELQDEANERAHEIETQLEKAAEKSHEDSAEALKDTAEKLAEDKKKAEKQASPAEKRTEKPLPNTKAGRKAAFDITMKEAQSHMSKPSQAFSKLIHSKPIEKTSEALGATVARPNALLAGSLTAFILTLAVYLVAKYYGYQLTGSETIAAFIIGWVVGILFDYLRVMITGKRTQ